MRQGLLLHHAALMKRKLYDVEEGEPSIEVMVVTGLGMAALGPAPPRGLLLPNCPEPVRKAPRDR